MMIGMNTNSFLISLIEIHSGSFQTITNIAGKKHTVNIESRFHGWGQTCIAEVEKKTINTVARQKAQKAAVPHISQVRYFVLLLNSIHRFFLYLSVSFLHLAMEWSATTKTYLVE